MNEDLHFVAGDARQVKRIIPHASLPAGQTLSKAWLTVKANLDDLDPAALFQKVITPTPGADGQIEDAGGTNDAVARFDVLGTDTVKLTPNKSYWYDVQYLCSASGPYTPEVGHVSVGPQVTKATS